MQKYFLKFLDNCQISFKKYICIIHLFKFPFFIGKSKKILENVTGYFRPERLMAIIGPSGAGKTTLLRTICSLKTTNVEGSIIVNDKKWNGSVFRKQTCFVPQEFVLLPLLTARETLYVAARLKIKNIHEPYAINLIVGLILI